MAVQQDSKVVALNTAHTAAVTEYTRTTSRGTSTRFGLVVKQEAVLVNLDEIAAARDVAKALVEEMKERLRRGRKAATSTLIKRAAAARAFAAGDAKTRDRYDPPGSRLKGNYAPGAANSDNVLSDSNRLIDGLTATPTRDGNFAFNVAKGRLDPATWKAGKGAPGIEIVWNLVMELIDVATLGQSERVQAAVEGTIAKMVTKYTGGFFQLGKAVQETAERLGETGEALEGLQ